VWKEGGLLMKILKIEFNNIGLFENGFAVDFIARDKVTNRNCVYNYHSSFYTQNVIALIGANASGKTAALQLINMVIDIILKQQPLEKISVPNGLLKDDSEMVVDFYDTKSKSYYRLVSVFGNTHISENENEAMNIKYVDEKLYKKNGITVTNKKQTTEFSEKDIISTRSKKLNEVSFLRDDDSILFYELSGNEEKGKSVSKSLINENMLNFYRVGGNASMIDINIFDNSIEELKLEDSQIKVKFKNKKAEISCNNMPNQNYLLSSGTAKGGNVLFWLRGIIRNGGYLVIDELENHFHKRLVEFVIELFNDEDINKKGATLIFTTHYAEILDSIERKDNIFVLVRDKKFVTQVIRYSDEVKRVENKKSEVFLSNFIKGTSPAYSAIQAFKESIWR
jgi:predicted ATP-dependent endonuclease of OLD family